MKKPYHIVFTTIYHPSVLEDLLLNVSKYQHLDEVCVWIVADIKTPESAKVLSKEITGKGLEVNYLDLNLQEEIGKKYSEFYKRIPFNNETRRNIGYLKALEQGCEVLISIDDDNFPVETDDFIGSHTNTGTAWAGDLISEQSGFHNVCEYIAFEPNRYVYPRGYPFDKRSSRNNPSKIKNNSKNIVGVTAGLWIVEPDVDATTWLNGKILGKGYLGEQIHVLAQDTWTPINTQNTSVVRDLIPAYLCIPMGWDVPGGKINRYGDIWGGYFLQALIKDTQYYVSFGKPLVEHRRNPHNYVDDMRHEYWGMMLTDWLLQALKDRFKPKEKNIIKRVFELADFLEEESKNNLPAWCPIEMYNFMFYTAENLRYWARACDLALHNE